MKFAIVPAKKVQQEVKGLLASLDEPYVTTRRMLVLGTAFAFLGGVVLGFLCAPDRTKNITIGSNNGDTFIDPLEDEEDEDEDEESLVQTDED